MADNVAITAGAGTTVAADEVTDGTLGTVKVQMVKIMDATLDSTNKLVVSAAGAMKTDGSAVTQPVSAASLPLPSGAAQDSTLTGGTQKTKIVDSGGTNVATVSAAGAVKVDASSVAVPITDNSGSLTVDAPVGTPIFATLTPSTTGGWSKSKFLAQTTTVQTVKGTAAELGGYIIYNPNASVAYVQLFDVASATTVTLGTTVPDMVIPLPAGAAANIEYANGVGFANGIKLACTTTGSGSTAPGTGLDMTILFK